MVEYQIVLYLTPLLFKMKLMFFFFNFFFFHIPTLFQFLSSIQRFYQTIDTTSIICITFLLQKLETFLSGYCATVNLYMVNTTTYFTTIAMEKKTPWLLWKKRSLFLEDTLIFHGVILLSYPISSVSLPKLGR